MPHLGGGCTTTEVEVLEVPRKRTTRAIGQFGVALDSDLRSDSPEALPSGRPRAANVVDGTGESIAQSHTEHVSWRLARSARSGWLRPGALAGR